MGMAKLIKILLLECDMTQVDLSHKLGKKPQNINAKLGRDNLREAELHAIAEACNATYEGSFILNDTGKEIK